MPEAIAGFERHEWAVLYLPAVLGVGRCKQIGAFALIVLGI
jgi:hypothetical protein